MEIAIKKQGDVNCKLNFLILSMGRAVSKLGSAIFSFALGLYVLDMTGSSAQFSMIISFSIIPGILINLFGGVFVDKANKKRILVNTDMLSGSLVLVFLVLLSMNKTNILFLSMYVICVGILQSIFELAINSSVPEFVSKEKVQSANSAFQGVGAVVQIAGPILGALLYKLIGIEMVLLIDGISFLLSGISEMFLKSNNTLVDKTEKSAKYLDDFKLAYHYLHKMNILVFFFIFAAIINFMYNPMLFIVLPFVNYNVLHVSGIQLSIIQISAAIGNIIAAIILMTGKSNSKLLARFFTLFRIQAVMIIFWILPALLNSGTKWVMTIVFGLIMIIIGMTNVAQNVPIISHFQVQVPEDIRARVFGVFITAIYVSTPLGMWLYGLLLEYFKWQYVTTITGVIMLVLSFAAYRNKHYQEFIKGIKEEAGKG